MRYAWVWAAVLGWASAVAVAQETIPPAGEVETIKVWVQIAIDAEGRTSRVTYPYPQCYMPAFMDRLRVQLAMRAFDPLVIDGKAVGVDTPARVTVALRPDGEGLVASILDVQPTPRPATMVSPGYPAKALAAMREGRIAFRCALATDGRCREIALVDKGVNMTLARAAREALRRWTFELPRYDGEPVGGTVVVPFVFTTGADAPSEGGSEISAEGWRLPGSRPVPSRAFPVGSQVRVTRGEMQVCG